VPPLRFRLRVAAPFDLRVALFGHGWIDLAPNVWDEAMRTLHTVLSVGRRSADVVVRQDGGALAVAADFGRAPPRPAIARASLGAQLARMLRLAHDYEPFWRRCRAEARLRWVARRGAGRLLAGATLFEDLMKLLFTTNCSWAATRLMARRLVDALGAAAPSGARAFPDAASCAAQRESFWRDVVRAGYRARACRELAAGFASGRIAEERFAEGGLPTEEVRRRLLALHGFGPYAAGQALRLLGRHDDLALDSWCRAKIAQQTGRRRPPPDRAIERAYAGFDEHRGLVLWMDLTREWHGEGVLQPQDAVVAALRGRLRRPERSR
jgi:N-glycosylase/DNA lyase